MPPPLAGWLSRAALTSGDSSDAGLFISPAECRNLTNPLPMTIDNTSVPMALVENYCFRWNNTFRLWNLGVRSNATRPANESANFIPFDEYLARWTQLESDIAAVGTNPDGTVNFDQILADKMNTVVAQESNEQAGTCVSVRVQIVQSLTLTREAFAATLTINNAGNSPLTNITVSIQVLLIILHGMQGKRERDNPNH